MAKISTELMIRKSKDWGWTQLAEYLGCSVEALMNKVSKVRPKNRRETLEFRLNRNERLCKEMAGFEERGNGRDGSAILRAPANRVVC